LIRKSNYFKPGHSALALLSRPELDSWGSAPQGSVEGDPAPTHPALGGIALPGAEGKNPQVGETIRSHGALEAAPQDCDQRESLPYGSLAPRTNSPGSWYAGLSATASPSRIRG
jgi:hypothetical protein